MWATSRVKENILSEYYAKLTSNKACYFFEMCHVWSTCRGQFCRKYIWQTIKLIELNVLVLSHVFRELVHQSFCTVMHLLNTATFYGSHVSACRVRMTPSDERQWVTCGKCKQRKVTECLELEHIQHLQNSLNISSGLVLEQWVIIPDWLLICWVTISFSRLSGSTRQEESSRGQQPEKSHWFSYIPWYDSLLTTMRREWEQSSKRPFRSPQPKRSYWFLWHLLCNTQ